MPNDRERRALVKTVTDASRQVKLRGSQVIIPEKFDRHGKVVTDETPKADWVFRRTTQYDLAFLALWKESGLTEDIDSVAKKANLTHDEAARLIKKLAWFKIETDRIKAIADVPTPAWITAKHLENVQEGGTMNDSQHRSLQETAKIVGAYKPTQSVNVQINLEKPAWTPEQEAKLREVYDTFAEPNTHAA